MPFDLQSIFDPKTKRCCPNRCHQQITILETPINTLVNRVLSILLERITNVENQLSDLLAPTRSILEERITQIESRLSSLYSAIQSDLLLRYSRIADETERILNLGISESDTPSEDETEEITPSKTEPITPTDSKVSTITPTDSKIPSIPPTPTSMGEGCYDVDFCPPLKEGWFWFWFQWYVKYWYWLDPGKDPLKQFIGALSNTLLKGSSLAVPPQHMTPEEQDEYRKKGNDVDDKISLYYEEIEIVIPEEE